MVILISLMVACPLKELQLSQNVAWAANESAGGAWSFLGTGIGARAMGMGGAFVALADDATAAYWNPAGLGLLNKREFTFMVIDSNKEVYPLTNRFLRRHQYLSGIFPIRISSGRFGLSGNYFSIGGIQHTTGTSELNFEKHGYFDDREWALTFSYGISLPDLKNPDRSWFFGGANIRLMRQSFFHLSTTGYGGDLGFILKNRKLWRFWNTRLGWVWNINLPRKWSSDDKNVKVLESYSDPAVIGWKWGLAFDIKEILTPAFTLTHRQKGSPLTYSAGVEIRITRSAFIRGGFEDVRLNENPLSSSKTVGFGFKKKYLQFDYAAALENLCLKHRISTTVRYWEFSNQHWWIFMSIFTERKN